MELETPQEHSEPAILSGPSDARGTELPAWFRDQQRAAWTTFESIPFPNRKDQPWRFSSVDALDLSRYAQGAKLTETERSEILDRSVALAAAAGRLIFADEQLLRRDPLPENLLKRGVLLMPIERALLEHEDLFRRHFMAQPATLGSAKFAALHEALVTSGTFAPTLQRTLAMALVDPLSATPGTTLSVDIRGRSESATVVPLPFYRRGQRLNPPV